MNFPVKRTKIFKQKILAFVNKASKKILTGDSLVKFEKKLIVLFLEKIRAIYYISDNLC